MSKYNQKTIDLILKSIYEKKWGLMHRLCEEYISQYPNDMYVIILYATMLLKLGRTSKARYLLNKVDLSKKPHHRNIESYFYAMVKVLLQEEKYTECLEYLNSNDNLFYKNEEVYYVRAFCQSQLGMPVTNSGFGGYIYNQIIDYSEEDAHRFINERAVVGTEIDRGRFNPEFDVDKCFKIVESRIPETLKYHTGIVTYESIFKADNCGTYDGQPTDLIIVIGLLHRNKILAMYPDMNLNNQKYTDISRELVIK